MEDEIVLERLVVCASCGGDKGHAVAYDYCRHTGAVLEYWEPCHSCGGSGEEWVEVQLIEEDDVYRVASE